MPQTTSPFKAADERKLMTEIWDPALADDLRRHVMFMYPWGKANTPLENFKEPRKWQIEELEKITDHIRRNKQRMAEGLTPEVYYLAIASGRGPGKSAFSAFINLWMMSTRLGSTVISSANTEAQLKTKTWAELGKWHTLAINSHWFERSVLALRPAPWFEDALKKQLKIDTGYYYAQGQLWSEENPDAFAGAHNMAGLALVFDEASGIPKSIWTVSEGFFTEPILHRYWIVFSNPRRNTGSFYDCFHTHRDFWNTRHIDSRTVEGTDPKVPAQIIAKHGADSDEAKIEVYGQFPSHSSNQFISRDIVENAATCEDIKDEWAPLIMGVDPARFGDDETVIRFRQGRDARSIPAIRLKGKDNMEVANICAHWIEKVNPDAVAVDAGNGTGIIDRLREMKYRVHEVWFGSKSGDPQYANKRTELWGKMKEWLPGAAIDNDADLRTDLVGPEYYYMTKTDAIMLESKEDMKARGLHSPDNADALCVTFSVNPARRDARTSNRHQRQRMATGMDYDVLG